MPDWRIQTTFPVSGDQEPEPVPAEWQQEFYGPFTPTTRLATQQPAAITGTVATAIAAPTVAATAVERFVGIASPSIDAAAVAAQATEMFRATGAVGIDAASLAVTGAQIYTAAAALDVDAPTVEIAVLEQFIAQAAISIAAPTADASGAQVEDVAGTATFEVTAPIVLGSSNQLHVAQGLVVIERAATESVGVQAFIGSGEFTVSAPTVAATQAGAVVGVGERTTAEPTLEAAGLVTLAQPQPAPIGPVPSLIVFKRRTVGTASVVVNESNLAASGRVGARGVAATIVAGPSLAAFATSRNVGLGNIAPTRPTMAVLAKVVARGTASTVASAPSVAATGDVFDEYWMLGLPTLSEEGLVFSGT
jgi:hypothetical protein